MLARISRFFVAVAAIYLTLFVLLPLLLALLGGLFLFFMVCTLIAFVSFHIMRWRGKLPAQRMQARFVDAKETRYDPRMQSFSTFSSPRTRSKTSKSESVIDAEFERLDD